ncbi:hypothetical protein ACFW9D_23185 [Streptomyces sp. NPDC059524]|uniref:hypothetical protein n=1 Tax=Streptomyces sp. NPDC059524 TaxID=3346856 RepID=UPI00369FAF4C
MYVFECAGCGAELTVPLSRVALPVHAHQKYGNGIQLPVLMEPGTFAVDREPSGPPWRVWEDLAPGEAAARGIHAPVYHLSFGAPGAVVLAPGDVRGTALVPERAGGYCCGLDGADGPNMACVACGLAVATRIDDCSLWQAVWLAPEAVRRRRVEGTDTTPPTWAELLAEDRRTSPFQPRADWAATPGTRRWWAWNPEWEAAAGRALAHFLAASEGRPVTILNGGPLVATVLQRGLDILLPARGTARGAALAGPGVPPPPDPVDILIVPTHSRTGVLWSPGTPGAVHRVPLPFGVWLELAFPSAHLPVPASGRLPDGVLRDDPAPPSAARHPFRADPQAFREALVRRPEVRTPWLSELLTHLTREIHLRVF